MSSLDRVIDVVIIGGPGVVLTTMPASWFWYYRVPAGRAAGTRAWIFALQRGGRFVFAIVFLVAGWYTSPNAASR